VNQVRYSLLSRGIETNGVLETARELGVTIIAYTPVARGLLTGRYHKNPQLLERLPGIRRAWMRREIARTRSLIEAMEAIAANYRATIAQVALNWLIYSHGELVVAIPGATRVAQAEENAGAMKFRLSAEEMDRLDEASRIL
jgi:aryl-alcohol dehydrogenase-like predicted oxidoreductase